MHISQHEVNTSETQGIWNRILGRKKQTLKVAVSLVWSTLWSFFFHGDGTTPGYFPFFKTTVNFLTHNPLSDSKGNGCFCVN